MFGAWAMLAGPNPAAAQGSNITWRDTATVFVSPGLANFSDSRNWFGPVPSQADTAIFGATTTPNISVSTVFNTYALVDGFTFLAGAPSYTFSVTDNNYLQFYGAGIVNGSGLTVTTANSQTQFFSSGSAGSASFINTNGILQFFNSSTAASATIANNAGGVVQFYGSSTAGNATITNNSGGTVQFYGNSTGGNARFINNMSGVVDFSNTFGPFGPLAQPDLTAGSIAGAGDFYLGANALIVGGNNLNTTVSGVISDCGFTGSECAALAQPHTGGSLVKAGTGSLTLTGANTWTGATVVNGGALTVSGGGSITNTPGNTIVGDTMGSIATMNVSGAGSQLTTRELIVGNFGNGTFNVLDGATVSVARIALADGGGIGTLNIDGIGSSLTTLGTLGGGGSDQLGFIGTATANVTNGGSLQFGGDVAMGVTSASTANLNISSGGSVTLNRFVIGDSPGSQATVTVSGAGSSLTSYDATSVGNNGTGALNVLDGATVTLGSLYVGGGNSGMLTLGPGAVANVSYVDSGTQMIVPSQFRLDSTGTLIYNISPAGTGLINAGTAELNGSLKFTGINAAAATYTLIQTTGGFTGTLLANLTTTNADINFGTLRNPNLRIVGNDLLLSVDANSLAAILQPGVTGTARQIADAVDAALLAGVTLPPGFNGVFNLSGDALVAALKQLSGQSAAGAQQTSFDASNSFMGAMFDPFAAGRAPAGGGAPGFASEDTDDAFAYAPRRKFSTRERDARNAVRGTSNNLYDPRWSVWGTAYGGTTTTTGSASQGTNDTTSRAFGFVTGADYNVNARTTVGFALGGGGSNYGVAGNLGSGRAEMFQAGLFARHAMGAAYVAGGLGYTFQNVTADRTVTVAGTDQLRATFNANTFSGRGEGGYRFATPVVGVTPYAALQVTNISLPNYGEVAIAGANTFALNYTARDTTIVRTELGARFDKSYALNGAMLTLRGRAAWAHDEGNDRRVSAVFGALPGSAFTINGAVPSKDLALVSAGAEMKWLNNVSLAATFEGEFGGNTTGYGGKGTVRYTW